ncbi:MAG: hypothetical protein R8M38_03880 [Mariprofundaceae bacterium]
MIFNSSIKSLCLLLLLASLLLSGCATQLNAVLPKIFINYASVLYDFERGEIMLSREKTLKIDKEHNDYKRAHELLRSKIEPARKRLLKHYKKKAKHAENKKLWATSAQYYAQALRLSLKKEALDKKLKQQQLRIRQVRLNHLIELRRQEDKTLKLWINSYRKPPKGLTEKDAPYMRKRRHHQELLAEWTNSRYLEARRYLRKGFPEVAWVEIESHLRMDPDSGKGKKLAITIKEAIPHDLVIPKAGKKRLVTRKTKKVTPTKEKPVNAIIRGVTVKEIREQMRKGNWLEAKAMASRYHSDAGRDANTLLKEVNQGTMREAERVFNKGQVAFSKEKLKEAVIAWQRAVELMPDNIAYWEQLQRAEQLQERLDVLRGETTTNGH